MKDNFEYLRETLKESDFNGHTSFQSLTFTQKLTWLSEAVESVFLLTKDNPGAACNRFFTSGDQGGSFRENRPPGPPTKAFD
jgi:hypothetical protein